jgi:hypothetical protein
MFLQGTGGDAGSIRAKVWGFYIVKVFDPETRRDACSLSMGIETILLKHRSNLILTGHHSFEPIAEHWIGCMPDYVSNQT